MRISLYEIKTQTPAFRKRWADACDEATQAVPHSRAGLGNESLPDTYDPLSMFAVLLKAHQKLDAVVDKSYEPCGRKKDWQNNAERVAFLFGLYEHVTTLLTTSKPSARRRKDG